MPTACMLRGARRFVVAQQTCRAALLPRRTFAVRPAKLFFKRRCRATIAGMTRLICVVIGSVAAAVLAVAAFNGASSHPPAAPHPATKPVPAAATTWKCPDIPGTYCG
jgi:hypothetical protein